MGIARNRARDTLSAVQHYGTRSRKGRVSFLLATSCVHRLHLRTHERSDGIARHKCDATQLPAELTGFDRVLVDAPCSGLGVLAARPDLRWRAQPLPAIPSELPEPLNVQITLVFDPP